MTFDAPTESFSESCKKRYPRRIAYASTIGGAPVDKETREIAAKSMEHFKSMGVEVDEIVLEIEDLESTFLALRSHQFVIDRELQLKIIVTRLKRISFGIPK